ILVQLGADVTVQESAFFYNDSQGDGGAVYSEGSFTSRASTYVDNTTTQDPNASFRGFGGAIASTGPLTMTYDTLAYNGSRYGGGLAVLRRATADTAAVTGAA